MKMTAANNNGPEVLEHLEADDHMNSAEGHMNKKDTTVLTLQTTTDINWHELPKDVEVAVPCSIPGCTNYEGEHVLSWGDSFHHVAFRYVADVQAQVSVDYYESDGDTSVEANTWCVNGVLADDDQPLTVDKVTEWMANYTSAACLAAELNGEAR